MIFACKTLRNMAFCHEACSAESTRNDIKKPLLHKKQNGTPCAAFPLLLYRYQRKLTSIMSFSSIMLDSVVFSSRGFSLFWSASKLSHDLPAKVQRVPLIPSDGVHQLGAIRQHHEQVLALTNHFLQLLPCSFAQRLWQGSEGKALCLCSLLESLQVYHH